MPDLVKICTNCLSEFVISEFEQEHAHRNNSPLPDLCLICRSIKAQEKRIPPKPKNPAK